MKTETELLTEVDEHIKKYGKDFNQNIVASQYPAELDTEFKKARFYCLVHACRHGLGYECLCWFYKFQESNPAEDPWKSANDALYEWDI